MGSCRKILYVRIGGLYETSPGDDSVKPVNIRHIDHVHLDVPEK